MTVDDEVEVDIEKVVTALAVAGNDDVGEDIWFSVMAATWRGSSGHPDALKAFVGWSQKSHKHRDRRTLERWKAFRRDTRRDISVRTLYHYADEAQPGWSEAYDRAALAEAFDQIRKAAAELKSARGGGR